MQYEKQDFNWFDKLTMYTAVLMLVGGIGALGYGAVSALGDSVKKTRSSGVPRVPMPMDTIGFNAAVRMTQEKSR